MGLADGFAQRVELLGDFLGGLGHLVDGFLAARDRLAGAAHAVEDFLHLGVEGGDA